MLRFCASFFRFFFRLGFWVVFPFSFVVLQPSFRLLFFASFGFPFSFVHFVSFFSFVVFVFFGFFGFLLFLTFFRFRLFFTTFVSFLFFVFLSFILFRFVTFLRFVLFRFFRLSFFLVPFLLFLFFYVRLSLFLSFVFIRFVSFCYVSFVVLQPSFRLLFLDSFCFVSALRFGSFGCVASFVWFAARDGTEAAEYQVCVLSGPNSPLASFELTTTPRLKCCLT